jgi:hypothetical protein
MADLTIHNVTTTTACMHHFRPDVGNEFYTIVLDIHNASGKDSISLFISPENLEGVSKAFTLTPQTPTDR